MVRKAYLRLRLAYALWRLKRTLKQAGVVFTYAPPIPAQTPTHIHLGQSVQMTSMQDIAQWLLSLDEMSQRDARLHYLQYNEREFYRPRKDQH